MTFRTPDDYFEAALGLLAAGGPRAVTIASLCAELGVSKGSFYHHFGGIPDFMERLLGYWERRGDVLMAQTRASVEPDQVLEMGKLTATWQLYHEAESAIRALARTDPDVAVVQRRVDQTREDVLRTTFVALGLPPGRARVLARLGMAILIGTQQREHPIDRRRLQETFAEYQCWLEQAVAHAQVR